MLYCHHQDGCAFRWALIHHIVKVKFSTQCLYTTGVVSVSVIQYNYQHQKIILNCGEWSFTKTLPHFFLSKVSSDLRFCASYTITKTSIKRDLKTVS